MHWPAESRRARPSRFPLLSLVAAVGLTFWLVMAKGRQPDQPTAPPAPPPLLAAPDELPTLQLEIATADWNILAAARERALTAGVIEQDETAVVPVSATLGNESATGMARLKGDWLDHIDTDQWSLRLELRSPLAGMRRFSIQHPKTRGFVMEWIAMTTARREGILAPRAEFVRVAINGESRGIYYLEEHFAKELLESQGRRESAIVRFGEDALWSTLRQYGFHRTGSVPREVAAAGTFLAAAPEAFGEAQAAKVDELNRRVHRSLAHGKTLQNLAITEYPDRPIRRLQAIAELENRTVDDLFVADRLGTWLAVYSLLRCVHGLAWHQLRFYHDPVLDRLEPIAFDTGANITIPDDTVALSLNEAALFLRSNAVWEAAYRALGRMTEPGWHVEWERAVRPGVQRATAAMAETGMLPPGFGADPIFEQCMPRQLALLRGIARPDVAAGFAAIVFGVGGRQGEQERIVEVDAWATTDVPVRVHGFRFPNGRVVPASATLLTLAGFDDVTPPGLDSAGSLLLPRDGSHVRFRFPIDRRLADLHDIDALKAAIRAQVEPDRGEQLALDVLYRPVAEPQPRAQALILRHLADPVADRRGRPIAPDRRQLLERHPFLGLELATGTFVVDKGEHEPQGDLVLPDTSTLRLLAGAQLRMQPGSVIVVGTLITEGTAQSPVVLRASDPSQGWAGLLVLGHEKSRLHHCHIESTRAIDRGGWQTTGGVNFHHAPVDFEDCVFRDSRGEDACNLFGVRFKMVRTEFRGATSDLLDGDFVHGEMIDCVFADSVGDAIDMSGSQVTVRGCKFTAIGDKAISAGEASRLRAEKCTVESASIAVASKDRSAVEIDGLRVAAVEHYLLAAFIKKPEYGAATIDARSITWGKATPAPHLVQQGCTVTVDGTTLPGVVIDVAELYRRKVLGK